MFERLRDIRAGDWKETSTAPWASSLVLLLVVAWFSHTGQRCVWFLDDVNLLFHEAGHPIFGLLWSLGQRPLEFPFGHSHHLGCPVFNLIGFTPKRRAVVVE